MMGSRSSTWALDWESYAFIFCFVITSDTDQTAQIDTFFQELPTRPSTHVIIEPHPDVLQHMKEAGWYEKPGVRVLEGKWQDFIESDEILSVGGFDVIYTDTFAEDYKGRVFPSLSPARS